MVVKFLHFAAHGDAFPLRQGEDYDEETPVIFDAGAVEEPGRDAPDIRRRRCRRRRVVAGGGDQSLQPTMKPSVLRQGRGGQVALATAGRDQGAEFGELEGAEEGVEGAADPDGDEEPGVGKDCGDTAGCANDADDKVIGADGDGDTKAQLAEDLEEFAFVFAIGEARRG